MGINATSFSRVASAALTISLPVRRPIVADVVVWTRFEPVQRAFAGARESIFGP